jgi:hypothetical protein
MLNKFLLNSEKMNNKPKKITFGSIKLAPPKEAQPEDVQAVKTSGKYVFMSKILHLFIND